MNVLCNLFVFDDLDDIAHFEDEVVFVVDLYLCSGVFVIHDALADFYGDFVFFGTRADGDHFCRLRFFLCRFGDDY